MAAGLDLDGWQREMLVWAMSRRADAKWAAFVVWWFLSRQNGKGSDLEARQLAGLVWHDKFAIHTAHELRTTAEHFLRMQQLIEGCPDIERRVLRIRTGKGDEAIEMRNGNRLRFIARSGGAGRGFAGVDTLYLDESMFLRQEIMRAIFSTMAAKSKKGNPQLWIVGTAPYGPLTESKGEAEVQSYAHGQVATLRNDEKRPKDTLYVDWGITPPTAEDVERCGGWDAAIVELVEDRTRWAAHNPALGVRIAEEFVENELTTLGPKGFAVERLGLVVPPEADNKSGIDLDEWQARAADGWEMGPGAVVGCAVDPAGSKGSLVAAQTIGGRAHVEVVAQGGLGELVGWCERNAGAVGSLRFVKASQDALLPALIGHTGIVCVPVPDPMGAQAAFVNELPVHRGDGRLRQAILAAEKKQVGDRWKWDRRLTGDPTALLAAAWAVSGLGDAEKSLLIL